MQKLKKIIDMLTQYQQTIRLLIQRSIKKILGITIVIDGADFIGLSFVARKKKAGLVYDNEPEQKSPLEVKESY